MFRFLAMPLFIDPDLGDRRGADMVTKAYAPRLRRQPVRPVRVINMEYSDQSAAGRPTTRSSSIWTSSNR